MYGLLLNQAVNDLLICCLRTPPDSIRAFFIGGNYFMEKFSLENIWEQQDRIALYEMKLERFEKLKKCNKIGIEFYSFEPENGYSIMLTDIEISDKNHIWYDMVHDCLDKMIAHYKEQLKEWKNKTAP